MKTLLIAVVVLTLAWPAASQQPVYEAGDGVTLPSVIKEVKPEYTDRAKKAGARGRVWLKCVVNREGKPTEITVARSLEPDLDKNAVAALEQWEFTPGTKNGEPVPVRVTVEMTFTLK